MGGGAVAPNGQTTLLAGTVGVAGYQDGTGSSVKFSNPIGMTMGPDGNIYVADQGAARIRKVTPAGLVTTFAGTGVAGAQNGNAIGQATFNAPWGLCFDNNGNMYVADYFNNMIRKITPAGIVSTYAGNGTAGFANAVAGAQLTAQFNHPTGVVADALGNVYVADFGNEMIRKIALDGTVSVFAGQAAYGYADGQGALAKFWGPETVDFDPQGNMIVADKWNNMIRKITPNGTVSTLAGQQTAGYVNATGISAKFNNPSAATVDPAGNIYVTDYNNNCVRKISSTVAVTTISGTTAAGSANGAGTAATFNNPYVIAIDGSGNLYIGDYLNQVVRKVLSTPYTISPALPAGLNFNTSTGAITGAATSYSPSTAYTITAYNLSGSASTTLTLSVSSAAVTPTQSMNYITTYTPRVANLTLQSQVISASVYKDQIETNIQYFDGLGRPVQTVQVKGSPNGRDMVQPVAYDAYGREATKYLPYAATGFTNSNGSYKTDALTTGAGVDYFYDPTGSGTSGNQQSNGIVVNPSPFSQTVFEASPLNRVVEQGAPGTPWQPVPNSTTGHTVKIGYSTNNATAITDTAHTTLVAQYKVTINSDQSRTLNRAAGTVGNYQANQLYVTTAFNENWTGGRSGTVEEYKDKTGHVILKRTFNYVPAVTGPPAVPAQLQILSTYYVYDDLGNLAFVLSPQANADNTTPSPTTLNNLCYQYRYDERNRLTQKRLPGKDWEYTVYNKLDQPVLIQDANLRANSQWMVTKYDVLGRAIMAGLLNSSATPDVQKTNVYTYSQWDIRDYTNTTTGYLMNSYPGPNTVLTINYYDDYRFSNVTGYPTNYTAPSNSSAMTKGLLTGKKTAVLNTPADMLWDVTYYDGLGRTVKSYAEHYLGGTANPNNYDAVNTTYSFTNALSTATRQHFTTGSTSAPMLTVVNTYLYDHMGRKTKTWEQLTYSGNLPTGNTLVSQVDYNEIGQMLTKHLHSMDSLNFLQNIAYAYNERGWLLSSSAPLFAMNLYYNTSAGTKAWNGNIMYQYWGTPGSLNSHYAYAYDALNRLIAGSSTSNYNEYPTYDVNGNITGLNRGVGPTTYVNTDQLVYSYLDVNSNYTNQVQSINELNTTSTVGMLGGLTKYTYDGNGNMLTQANTNTANNLRDKTYTYNLLNLPKTVTIQTSATTTGTLTYTYDAAGNKLRKASTVISNTTDYIDGIQYDSNQTPSFNFIQTEEGKAAYLPTTGGFDYYYYLGDNLGNTRLTFDTKTNIASTYQTDDYYPFGLEIPSGIIPNPKIEYLYNKKELQEELGQYDYGARFYDPTIARWTTIDPLAERNRKRTPYNYVNNNPVRLIDPDGMDAVDPVGADGLTNDQWVQASMPGRNPSLADAFREQNNDQEKEQQQQQSTQVTSSTGPGDGPAWLKRILAWFGISVKDPTSEEDAGQRAQSAERLSDLDTKNTEMQERLDRVEDIPVAGGAYVIFKGLSEHKTGMAFAGVASGMFDAFGGELVSGVGMEIKSLVKSDPQILRLARQTFKGNDALRQEANNLLQQVSKGIMNPGRGTRLIGNGIYELRGWKEGAGIYFRNAKNGIEILGYSSKENQAQVIKAIQKVF